MICTSDDEADNVITVTIDNGMNREDVLELVLKEADNFYSNKNKKM